MRFGFCGIVLAAFLLTGCSDQTINYSGKVHEIRIGSGGYWADLVIESEDGKPKRTAFCVPLTLTQSKAIKTGDDVGLTIIYGPIIGEFKELRDIHKK